MQTVRNKALDLSATPSLHDLLDVMAVRDLDVHERAAAARLSGDQQSELGKARMLRLEHEAKARMAADPVFGQGPTPDEEAAIASAWAATEPASAAFHDATIAVEAARLNHLAARRRATSENDPDVAEAMSLWRLAERQQADALAARERAFETAREAEADINARVRRRFAVASHKANVAGATEAQRAAAAGAGRPDPRPALYADHLARLRGVLGRKAGA